MDINSKTLLFRPVIINSDSKVGLNSHAIILKRLVTFSELSMYFKKLALESNAIFSEIIPDNSLFSIAEVRELQSKLSLKTNQPRLVLVKADKLPAITQNSLLKLMEEGSMSTNLIITTLPTTVLLPTLSSRVLTSYVGEDNPQLITDFMSKNVADRLSAWDSMTDSDLSQLAFQLLQSETINSNPQVLKGFSQAYQAWQAGILANKYFYEYLCLTI